SASRTKNSQEKSSIGHRPPGRPKSRSYGSAEIRSCAACRSTRRRTASSGADRPIEHTIGKFQTKRRHRFEFDLRDPLIQGRPKFFSVDRELDGLRRDVGSDDALGAIDERIGQVAKTAAQFEDGSVTPPDDRSKQRDSLDSSLGRKLPRLLQPLAVVVVVKLFGDLIARACGRPDKRVIAILLLRGTLHFRSLQS